MVCVLNMLYSFVYLNEIFTFKWLKFELNLIVSLTLCINVTSAVKSLQSCLTLCNPIDGSPPGSAIPGILQARTLEWVAISFSNAWKWKVKVKLLSGVWLLATPWNAAHQTPPSMGFSRQEYWSGVPLPSPNVTSKASQLANFCITFVYGFCFVLFCPRHIVCGTLVPQWRFELGHGSEKCGVLTAELVGNPLLSFF